MFIVLLIIIVLNFSIPNYSKAFSFGEIAGDLLKELVNMVASVGDVVMGALNHFMLGTEKIITSSMLSQDDPNLSNGDSWLKYDTRLVVMIWTDFYGRIGKYQTSCIVQKIYLPIKLLYLM